MTAPVAAGEIVAPATLLRCNDVPDPYGNNSGAYRVAFDQRADSVASEVAGGR